MPKFTSIEKGKLLSERQFFTSGNNKNCVEIHYNPEAATLEYFQQHIAGAVGNMWRRQYEENMKANKEARHENVKI